MVRRTPVVAILMTAFLAAHLVCVCAAPAFATALTASRTAADPHACCHPNGTGRVPHRRAPGCTHCTHAQLSAPEAATIAGPAATSMVPALGVPPTPPHLAAPRVGNTCTSVARGHAPPPRPTRVSVLQI